MQKFQKIWLKIKAKQTESQGRLPTKREFFQDLPSHREQLEWTDNTEGKLSAEAEPRGSERRGTDEVSHVKTWRDLLSPQVEGGALWAEEKLQKPAWSPPKSSTEYQSARAQGDTARSHAENATAQERTPTGKRQSQQLPEVTQGRESLEFPTTEVESPNIPTNTSDIHLRSQKDQDL